MKFYLPDFYYFYNLNYSTILLLREHPEYFIDGLEIASLYGTFPECVWNGGRTQSGQAADYFNIRNTINAINEVGVAIRFTYTNVCLNENLFQDGYANQITELGHNGKNEILVNDPKLEDYLRSKYPNYKYISSTTKCLRDINAIKEEIDKYDMVVIDYRDNKNKEFINQIKQKNKVELLVNACCNPDCKRRQEHYKLLSQSQLGEDVKFFHCEFEGQPFYKIRNLPTVFSNEEIEEYVKLGFTNFKLEGRNNNIIDVIDNYTYYLIKPEYRDKYKNDMLKMAFASR